MTYDELATQYDDVKIKEVDFSEIDPEEELSGLCINNNILIRGNLPTTIEKKCVLAEELGHYHTSYGNILDQKHVGNVKQEKRARNWAYEKLIPLDKLIEAYKSGAKNRHETAEFLDVIEEFLEESIKHYQEKYGLFVVHGGFTIYFDPFEIQE